MKKSIVYFLFGAISISLLAFVTKDNTEGNEFKKSFTETLKNAKAYTLEVAEKIVTFFKNKDSTIQVFNDEILIEKAIENQSNLIFAPDGISGNLIYRTLVHLGGVKAHGAIYLGLEKIIIDTSRAGNVSEIIGAIIIALSLV